MGRRATVSYLAMAVLMALAGCQTSGSGNSAHDSWWDWGAKTPPPSTSGGSPFSTAATYNRNNTSDMGISLYDGTRAKQASPPCNPTSNSPSAVPPSSGVTPQVNPGAAYPQGNPTYGNMGPGAVPSGQAPGGPVAGPVGPAPTGYWIYQPANGYPGMNPYGGGQVIPVYGPPMGGMPGNGPAMPGVYVPPTGPVGAYPPYNPMNSQPMAPANGPFNPAYPGGAWPPSNPAPGGQFGSPAGYAGPAAVTPQGISPASYAPGVCAPGNPGTAALPYAQQPSYGPGPPQSAAVPGQATGNWPR